MVMFLALHNIAIAIASVTEWRPCRYSKGQIKFVGHVDATNFRSVGHVDTAKFRSVGHVDIVDAGVRDSKLKRHIFKEMPAWCDHLKMFFIGNKKIGSPLFHLLVLLFLVPN